MWMKHGVARSFLVRRCGSSAGGRPASRLSQSPDASTPSSSTLATPSRATGNNPSAGASPFSTSAPSTWQHPGFVVSKAQLNFVKSQISSNAQPWSDAYTKMLKDSDKYGLYVSAQRSSKAIAIVECGPTTNPDIGCSDERGDALAAWSNALAGYVTGNQKFTLNAIEYMNKWSTVVKCKFPIISLHKAVISNQKCSSHQWQCGSTNCMVWCVMG